MSPFASGMSLCCLDSLQVFLRSSIHTIEKLNLHESKVRSGPEPDTTGDQDDDDCRAAIECYPTLPFSQRSGSVGCDDKAVPRLWFVRESHS